MTNHRLRSCRREGCPREYARGFEWCSYMCRAVDTAMTHAEEACRRLGLTPESTEVWLAAVELNDAATRLHETLTGAGLVATTQGFVNSTRPSGPVSHEN